MREASAEVQKAKWDTLRAIRLLNGLVYEMEELREETREITTMEEEGRLRRSLQLRQFNGDYHITTAYCTWSWTSLSYNRACRSLFTKSDFPVFINLDIFYLSLYEGNYKASNYFNSLIFVLTNKIYSFCSFLLILPLPARQSTCVDAHKKN